LIKSIFFDSKYFVIYAHIHYFIHFVKSSSSGLTSSACSASSLQFTIGFGIFTIV